MNNKRAGGFEAILLDLDGTLLDLNVEDFISAYIDLLAMRFAGKVDRDLFADHLFQSTGIMVQNTDPGKKNIEVFYDDFCRRIGMSMEEIEPIVSDFYKHDFPTLNSFGREHPYARSVIDAARNMGLPLVLATNPIFPQAAVAERLNWGGLSTSLFMFVTSMENMHFCKPNPDYYREIAARIGCRPEKCLMAGNDTLEDLSASEAGMKTFLVEDHLLHRGGGEPVCDYRGRLKDLVTLIKS